MKTTTFEADPATGVTASVLRDAAAFAQPVDRPIRLAIASTAAAGAAASKRTKGTAAHPAALASCGMCRARDVVCPLDYVDNTADTSVLDEKTTLFMLVT